MNMHRTHLRAALIGAAGLGLALLIFPAGLRAQSAAGALQDFGLLGTWASECAQDASPMNNHATFSSTAAGGAQLRYESGADFEDSIYAISNAKLVEPDKLAMRQVLVGNEQVTLDIVLLKDNNRIRIWSSAFPDGTPLVEEGVLTSFTGRETRWMTRCP
jgi:hypothetical protein